MRDRDVRKSVLEKLEALHRGDSNTIILNEFGIWRGSVRVDIAVINGEMHGYELKSAADNLERLHFQSAVYSSVLDRVTLVIAERHVKKALEFIPKWWGVELAKQASNEDRVVLEEVRPSAENQCFDKFRLAFLLWRDEAIDVLDKAGLSKGIKSKSREHLADVLASSFDEGELRGIVRERVKSRRDWISARQQTQCDG